MSEEQVEQQVDDSEDIDALDDRVESVVSHSRELEELREQKRERMLSDTDSDSEADKTRGSDVVTGWIREAERNGDTYTITVEVVDGDETSLQEFDLDWPSDWEEATIENDVVALAHLIGDSDGLDDILEQEIPVIRTEDGDYVLAIPDKPTLIRRLAHWGVNRAISIGAIEASGGRLRLNSSVFYAGLTAGSLLPIALGATTLGSIITASSSLLTGAVTVIGGTLIMAFLMTIVAGFLSGPPEASHHGNGNEDDVGGVIFALELGIVMIATLLTNHHIGTGGMTIGELAATGANIAGGTAFLILGLIGLAYGVKPGLVSGGKWTVSKLIDMRDWVRRQRGIDYLR